MSELLLSDSMESLLGGIFSHKLCANQRMKSHTDHFIPPACLSATDLNFAITRLAELVADAGLVLELGLCHGRVFTTIFLSSGVESSRGKCLVPTACAADLARLVAEEQGLSLDWLQHAVKYSYSFFAESYQTGFDLYAPSILISLPEPSYLLALKLQLFADEQQPVDKMDIRFLLGEMELASPVAVEAVHQQFPPDTNEALRVTSLIAELQPLHC